MADQNNGYGAKDVQAIPVETFLVKYTDGNGEEEVRMGFFVGNDVRFLKQDSLSKPAQTWLRDEIFRALGKAVPGSRTDAPAPLPAPPSLETQV